MKMAKPVLYRYRDSESVIRVMDGYTPGDGWTPLYEAPVGLAELLTAAKAARDMIAIERQFFVDCNVVFDGVCAFFEPDDQAQIDDYDAMLRQLDAAIATSEGGAP